MSDSDLPVLVIGATGFVGRRVVSRLRATGRSVRCLVRTPTKADFLAADGVEVVQGDMLKAAAAERAIAGVAAVIMCVHTISPQPANKNDDGFMDVEAKGLRNVTAGCAAHGVRRVLYVTAIGVAKYGPSSWLRGRWATEQALLSSGLDATVVRPGMIVGRGGGGFNLVTRAATRSVAMGVGSAHLRFRTISVDDLAQDLVDLIDEPESFGKTFDAGSDDVLTMRQMAAIAAASIGRRPGHLLFMPAGLVRALAPVVERLTKVPKGAISGFVGDGPQEDMIGNPTELRAVLGRNDRPFHEAIVNQL